MRERKVSVSCVQVAISAILKIILQISRPIYVHGAITVQTERDLLSSMGVQTEHMVMIPN